MYTHAYAHHQCILSATYFLARLGTLLSLLSLLS